MNQSVHAQPQGWHFSQAGWAQPQGWHFSQAGWAQPQGWQLRRAAPFGQPIPQGRLRDHAGF